MISPLRKIMLSPGHRGSAVKPNGSPSNLVLTVLSDTSIKLDWTIGSTNQDGCHIYDNTDTLVATVTGSTATKTLNDLTANTQYGYYVKTYKGGQESAASITVYATTWTTEFVSYKSRVETDGGSVENSSNVSDYISLLKSQALWDSTKFLWTADSGVKERISGIFQYASKLYSATGSTYDASQATNGNQFFLRKGIAPGEKKALVNVYRNAQYMTHSQISYASGAPFSYCFCGNMNEGGNIENIIAGGKSLIKVSVTYQNYIQITTEEGTVYTTTKNGSYSVGKNRILHIIYDGSYLYIYVEGELKDTIAASGKGFIFGKYCIGNQYSAANEFSGRRFVRRIQDGAMTAAQVLAETNYVRSKYAKSETITIGTKIFTSSNLNINVALGNAAIADGTVDATWQAGAAAWCYHATGLGVYGRLYNKAARDLIVANPPIGFHVATEAELTELSLLGGNALKIIGTDLWNTEGGTNVSGFSAVGAAYRNADASWGTWKDTATFWCADSDKVLKVYHNSDTAEIVSAEANEGHAIRLVKNNALGLVLGDSVIASYNGSATTYSYLFSSTEIINGNKVLSTAVVGSLISGQKSLLQTENDKELYDFCVVEIGNNDLGTKTALEVFAELQDLVDTINAYKKTGAVVIVCTLAFNTSGVYADFNNLIINSIEGVSAICRMHECPIVGTDGTVKTEYRADAGDPMHPNNAGRAIIAATWRTTLNSLMTIS